MSILLSLTRTSISSLCFVSDGALREQISKPLLNLGFLIKFKSELSFCLYIYNCYVAIIVMSIFGIIQTGALSEQSVKD